MYSGTMRTRLSPRPAAIALACLSALLFPACNLKDADSGLLNAARVDFSAGSPAVDGQTVTYSGGLLTTPSLDKFQLRMVFHVKADNSRNSGKAVFGTDAVQPVLNFRILSKANAPVAAPIPSFSIAGGAVEDLEFPVAIPLALLDKSVVRRIVDGEPIPYFLSGALQFELLEGTVLKGTGKSELDLTSGEIATRPSGTVVDLLSGLL
jgi:hypothetical protein